MGDIALRGNKLTRKRFSRGGSSAPWLRGRSGPDNIKAPRGREGFKQMKEYEKAIDAFSKFIDKFDPNTSQHKEGYKLGTIGGAFAYKTDELRELGKFPESLESAENGLKSMSSLPDTEYNIDQKKYILQEKGLTLMKMDDYKAAKTCFEEALKTESKYVTYFFSRIIECCKKLGDSECLKDYEQKLKDATDSDEKS